jgi:hypothetical protein
MLTTPTQVVLAVQAAVVLVETKQHRMALMAQQILVAAVVAATIMELVTAATVDLES